MSNILITSYQMGWNPKTNQGIIQIRVQSGEVIKVPVENAQEFSAISLVLNESPIFLNTENGFIATADWEPVS